MENNMSDIINKFNTILKDKNIDLNNLKSSTAHHSQSNDPQKTSQSAEFNSNLFGSDFDISTLLKFKNIFDKANNKNNPRNQLLSSLKPFLNDKRKEKLEQYTKIANILYVLNSLNKSGNN